MLKKVSLLLGLKEIYSELTRKISVINKKIGNLTT